VPFGRRGVPADSPERGFAIYEGLVSEKTGPFAFLAPHAIRLCGLVPPTGRKGTALYRPELLNCRASRKARNGENPV
jgi:hypothetical protein